MSRDRDQIQAELDYCQFLATRVVYNPENSALLYRYMGELHARLNKLEDGE